VEKVTASPGGTPVAGGYVFLAGLSGKSIYTQTKEEISEERQWLKPVLGNRGKTPGSSAQAVCPRRRTMSGK
jgi:hypothetical protein